MKGSSLTKGHPSDSSLHLLAENQCPKALLPLLLCALSSSIAPSGFPAPRGRKKRRPLILLIPGLFFSSLHFLSKGCSKKAPRQQVFRRKNSQSPTAEPSCPARNPRHAAARAGSRHIHSPLLREKHLKTSLSARSQLLRRNILVHAATRAVSRRSRFIRQLQIGCGVS